MIMMKNRGAMAVIALPPGWLCARARVSAGMEIAVIPFLTACPEERKGLPLRKEPFANVSPYRLMLREALAVPTPGAGLVGARFETSGKLCAESRQLPKQVASRILRMMSRQKWRELEAEWARRTSRQATCRLIGGEAANATAFRISNLDAVRSGGSSYTAR